MFGSPVRTASEKKLEIAVQRVQSATGEIVYDLKHDKTVPTDLLVDALEVQSNLIDSLLQAFLDS